MTLRFITGPATLARAAAEQAAATIRNAIAQRDCCRVVLAAGSSQLAFLHRLTAMTRVDWKKVEAFPLDGYVGMPMTHPASFRKFLLQRVIFKVGISKY